MVTPVEMPKPGVTVEECLLVKWNKQAGETVASGEIIAEIETDKATFEIAAPVDGVLLERFFSEGDLVPVYTNLCAIGGAGESAQPFRPAAAAPKPAASSPAPAAGAAPGAPVVQQAAAPVPAAPATPAAQAALSPRARRFAEEHGFSPAGVRGSGPQGRVLESDLERAYRSQPRRSYLAQELVEQGFEVRGPGSGIGGMTLATDLTPPPVKVGGVRERVARRMRESLGGTAQYTLTSSAEATGLLALRAKIKAAQGAAPDVNINDMVMFCTVKALLRMPELNAEFIDGKLYRHTRVNLGFACDTDRGLLVPVIATADKMTLAELGAKVKELTKQAQEGSIAPDDLTGATFTVSNLGNLGIESFTPILNPPQVGILGVNAIELKPVRKNGAIEFVDRIGFSLTLDHQVIDGAPGARFLLTLRECIEGVEALAGLKF